MSTRQVIGYLASDASLAKHRSKVMGARLWKALEFADDHQSVFDVMDQTRLEAIQTDKAEPAKDLFGAEQLRKLVFVSQAVLEREHSGVGADQWRQQLGKSRIGRRLQRDEDQFANADLFG